MGSVWLFSLRFNPSERGGVEQVDDEIQNVRGVSGETVRGGDVCFSEIPLASDSVYSSDPIPRPVMDFYSRRSGRNSDHNSRVNCCLNEIE